MVVEKFKRIKGITLKGFLVVLLCGAIFGYGTGVISNVNGSFFYDIPADRTEFTLAFITSAAILGAFFGSFIAAFLCDWVGRKKTLLIAAITCLLGNIVCMLAFNKFYILAIGRFIFGLSLGALSSVGPLYLSETCPDDMRGFLGVFFQFSITFTIFLASLAAFAVANSIAWLVMLGLLFIPILLLLFIIPSIPMSPRYLVGIDDEMAKSLFLEMYPNQESKIMEDIQSIKEKKAEKTGWGEVFSSKNAQAILIGLALAIGQQFTGINAIIYYSGSVFQSIVGNNATMTALAVAVLMGWNCLTSMCTIPLISMYGRRTLLLVGQTVMFVSLGITAVAYFFSGPAVTWIALIGIALFILGFEFSVGPLFFVVIFEIFQEKIRGLVGSAMTGIQWFFNFILTVSFPFIINSISPPTQKPNGYVFFIFMAIGVLAFLVQLFYLPETKDKDFKEIQEMLQKKGTYFNK